MERLRILIVDDEEDLVSTMAERLTLRGFQVETATNGTDAIKHVSKHNFSVLILDVKMPGIDGLELMAEIKRKHPDLPVILFTGHTSVADAERGMQEGAFDYIMKPIDIDELIDKIRSAVGGKKGRK
ncbi:MAG: sigma-54-dependent transcriptional regulator [Planctomycetota bacterium]|jgi:DNA-binding NtrC family response regulator